MSVVHLGPATVARLTVQPGCRCELLVTDGLLLRPDAPAWTVYSGRGTSSKLLAERFVRTAT